MMVMVVAFSIFPNKTCDLAAEKFSFSKFRFKVCAFGTTTPTANFERKNHNFEKTETIRGGDHLSRAIDR